MNMGERPAQAPETPRFCMTELSLAALIVGALCLSVVLWLAIMAVI